MASTYSTNLRFELIATGEQDGTWGDTTNINLGTLIEEAISGVASVTHDDSASYSLTTANGLTDEARQAVLEIGGTLTAARNVVCPASEKVYIVKNDTAGGFDITIKTSGGTGITVPNGETMVVYCDGTNVVNAVTNFPAGTSIGGSEIVTLTGTQTLTNKTLTSPEIAAITNSGATLTLPSSSTTLVGTGLTQTLTNKTIDLTDNTLTGTLAEFNTACSDADFCSLTGTETLTNKTLTSPVIAFISNTGTLTLPTATTTLVGRSTTDTLTNKTLTTPTISSPTLTGTPVAPTAATGTNTTQVATTEFVVAEISATGSTPDGVDVSITDSGGYYTGTDVEAALQEAAVLTQGQHSIWIPATAMVPLNTNGAESNSIELATNDIMVSTLDFDATTSEHAQFDIQMPKSWNGGTVVAQFVWSHPATTTNFGVVWRIAGRAHGDGGTLDQGLGTAQTATDTGGNTNRSYISPETSAVTLAGSPAGEQYCIFKVSRLPADASDTLAVDARLHGVKVHYTTNANTDD